MSTNAIQTAALEALAAGLNVLPPREDGSKAPDAPEWASRQHRLTTEAEIMAMYANGRTGLGVVTGAVSGGLELFEFEGRAVAAGLGRAFVEAAAATGLGPLVDRIHSGYSEHSPGGGLHWLYRCPNPSTTKLARTEERLPLIETKGEGGYAITAPSAGRVHPTGKPWRMVEGRFATIVSISADEHEALHRIARTFDQAPRPAPEQPYVGEQHVGAADGSRPGDDFNARATWAEVLEPHGWTKVYDRGDTGYWRRPGKEGPGISATTDHRGSGLLYVFTSSTIFEPERSYDRFGSYAALSHGGDFAQAARTLSAEGYGVRSREASASQLATGDSPAGPSSEEASSWPVLDAAALHGLAGEVVATLDPHTEADPAAVLVSLLVAFGAAVNSGPHAIADGAEHPARLFAVLVGRTSRGRKGTAWANVRRIFAAADPGFTAERILGGLASGEGLVAAVGDGTIDKDGNTVGAVVDKRVLVLEPEFARVLKVCARDSSTLSALLRDAWDRGDLRVMTRKDPLRASGAHICLMAHITADELRRGLAESEAANGYGNRHLFIAARRSKRLPAGGNLDEAEVHSLGLRVRSALAAARRVGILRRSPDAAALWEEIYNNLDDEADGMVGALTARAEAQLLRLSVVYALLDGSHTVEVAHIRAAHAVWQYAEGTLRYVFGDTLGDEVADRLLAAVRDAGDEGLDRQAQRDVFGRNVPAPRLALARETLERRGLVVTTTEETGGRPRTVTRALRSTQEDAFTQEGRPS